MLPHITISNLQTLCWQQGHPHFYKRKKCKGWYNLVSIFLVSILCTRYCAKCRDRKINKTHSLFLSSPQESKKNKKTAGMLHSLPSYPTIAIQDTPHAQYPRPVSPGEVRSATTRPSFKPPRVFSDSVHPLAPGEDCGELWKSKQQWVGIVGASTHIFSPRRRIPWWHNLFWFWDFYQIKS